MTASVTGAFTSGSTYRRLQAALAARFGFDHVVGTDSGTTALRLAVGAAAGESRLPVALPAWGCFDLATALDGAGLPVRLYDIDPATLGPDWDHFRQVLGAGVSAAVVVHPFGFPVDAARASALTLESGVPLIEDAAQAAGALVDGRPAGSVGDLTVLSFGRGKGLTGGGGGAVMARAGAIGDRLAASAPQDRSLGVRNVPVLAALLCASPPPVYGLVAALPFLGLGETPYHAPWPPRGLSRLAAGAVLETLTRLERGRQARRAVATRLLAAAGACGPRILAGTEPGFLRLPVVLPAGPDPGMVRTGVAPGYPKALCDLPGFRDRVDNRGDGFAGARTLADRLCTLPTHRWVSDGDLAVLERWLASVCPGGA